MATPLDTALDAAQKTVPECIAAGFVNMKTGTLLGAKTIDNRPQEMLDLVATAMGDIFQGSATASEKLFCQSRRVMKNRISYFQEIIVRSEHLVHVLLRCRRNQDMVFVTVCRTAANLGMVLAKTRASLAAVESAA